MDAVRSHCENSAEASLVGHHVVEGLVCLGERESLAHALDIEAIAELHRILRIEGVTRRPSVDRDTLGDHGEGVDRDITDG